MNASLKKFGILGIVLGVALLCYGGFTIINHGVPREPLPLEGR
jgi:hypothetical protein